jgi:AraC family transcriptional regulator, dual regulator of chb operon
MGILKLRSKDLINSKTEIHYAYHKSLKGITIAHTHDFYEIFLITKGKAFHLINGVKEVLGEGMLVFIRPDDIHHYEKMDGEICELINLAFRASTLSRLLNYFGEGFNSERIMLPKLPPVIKLSKIEKESLIAKFESLNALSRKKEEQIKTEFRILIAEIFAKYFLEIKKEIGNEIPQWLLKLRGEMERKDNFVLGIERMYELSERSPEHLSRTFKKYFKETPTDFLTHLRLNYAANLLANSDETIAGISMEAGYDNLSHFYHLFKKYFDLSPKEFRLKNQKFIIPF